MDKWSKIAIGIGGGFVIGLLVILLVYEFSKAPIGQIVEIQEYAVAMEEGFIGELPTQYVVRWYDYRYPSDEPLEWAFYSKEDVIEFAQWVNHGKRKYR